VVIFLLQDSGALAQLGERLVCNQEVIGSIPIRSIDNKNGVARSAAPFFVVDAPYASRRTHAVRLAPLGSFRHPTSDIAVNKM
jgi:hypothetical protein